MSLSAFQQALCELIASPALCLAVRADASEFMGRYDLSQRERDRLLEIVWQRGMSTNCTLYRSNRVTPIYTLLHYTCEVLGDRLKDSLEAYWANTELRDLEFKHEIERFSHFLKRRIAEGLINDALLEEVLDFELAINELRFAPRRQILDRLRHAAGGTTGELRLHPLMRVVRFNHDPAEVLGALAQRRIPRNLPERESFLLLSVADENLSASDLEPQLGRLLWRVHTESVIPHDSDLNDLVGAGFLCSAQPDPVPEAVDRPRRASRAGS